MNEPLVSVLMTSFNRAPFIASAIESVQASSYRHFELIIVDDGSTDDTVAIARRYAAADERIRVYLNEKNLGDYFNRNQAARYASGKYLKYLDSDDLIYPFGLEIMVKSMEAFPAAGLGLPYYKIEDDRPYPYLVEPAEAYRGFFISEDFMLTGPTGSIILRTLFESVGGFSGKRYIGDNELWLKLSARTPVVKFQPALYWWRKHPTQEFRQGQALEGYATATYQLVKDTLGQTGTPLTAAEKKFIIDRLDRRQGRMVLSLLIKKQDFRSARTLMRSSGLRYKDLIRAAF